MERTIDTIFKTLSSLKLTIAVLFALTLASIPGTLVDPQKTTYDFYHSWWFTSLLFLLTLNLIACTFYRKQTRLAVLMVHFSIFFILMGGIAGSRLGFRGALNLQDGETASAVRRERSLQTIPLPFQVRSEGFRLRHYKDSNRPSDYESDLVILEDGKIAAAKTVRVNDPLRHKGITFYQANYGESPKGFLIRIKDQTSGKIMREEEVKEKISLKVVDYTPDFQGFGPAALVRVEKTAVPPQDWILFKNYPDFEAKRRGRYLPVLAGMETSFYTGLQVVKDPGVPIVWTGCGMLVAGLALSFWSPKSLSLNLSVRKLKPSSAVTEPVYAAEVES